MKAFEQLSAVVPEPAPTVLPAPALLTPPLPDEINTQSAPAIPENAPEPVEIVVPEPVPGGAYGRHMQEMQRRRDVAEAAADAATPPTTPSRGGGYETRNVQQGSAAAFLRKDPRLRPTSPSRRRTIEDDRARVCNDARARPAG